MMFSAYELMIRPDAGASIEAMAHEAINLAWTLERKVWLDFNDTKVEVDRYMGVSEVMQAWHIKREKEQAASGKGVAY